jgi:GDP-L-fucose synthase
MNPGDKIFVAGHRGLIGSALCRRLRDNGYTNLITADRSELELADYEQVKRFFEAHRPDSVFLAAGKVGGVYANNTYRAEFIHDNLIIQTNVIHQAFLSEVKKLVFFSCSCVYPKMCPQPMREEHLLSGSLEPTNEPFAIAKIAGMKMCESYNRQYGTDFISVIPTNIYGINQNYDRMNSLVIPALIRKFHEAKESNLKEVVLWGTGRPARDFLFSDDLADAAIFLTQEYSGNDTFNIGTGKDYSIHELAEIIRKIVGFNGKIIYDASKPDGVIMKLQDVSRLTSLGWKYKVELEDGMRIAYQDFLKSGRKGQ